MSGNYPIMLQLEGKKVVVIGGGKVAERKVNGLLSTGASISVVSPEATAALQRLSQDGEIQWLQKPFSEGDIQEAFMVFAATNDTEINHAVKSSAAPHQLVSIADDPVGSNFHLPAHFKRGRLSITISTGGASPKLAQTICKQLEQQFDEKYEDYLDFLFTTRQWILKEVKDTSLKSKLLTAIVSHEFLNSQTRAEDFWRLYDEIM